MPDDGSLPFPAPDVLLGKRAASLASAAPPKPASSRPPKHVRRLSSKGSPKKAAPKKTAAVESNAAAPHAVKEGSVIKPKQTKSRNGCATCKLKRLKCGEEKPKCINCEKRGVECGGYKKVFQWRDYGSGQGMMNFNFTASKQAPASRASSGTAASAGSLKTDSPSSEGLSESPGATRLSADIPNPTKSAPSPSAKNKKLGRSQPRKLNTSSSPEDDHRRHDSAWVPEEPSPHPPDAIGNAYGPNMGCTITPHATFAYGTRSLTPAPNHGSNGSSLPMTAEAIGSDPHRSSASPESFVPFSMPEDAQLPLWSPSASDPALFEPGILDGDIDIIGPIQPTDIQPFQWPHEFEASLLLNSTEPPEFPAPWNYEVPFTYAQPDFRPDQPAALEARFDQRTCAILSVMNGPSENPWRSVVWPMAQYSEALYHALLAMTAFHAAYDEPELKTAGFRHKDMSLKNIKEGIKEESIELHAAIATALALGFAETWDQPTGSGNVHIKGAQILVTQALERHHQKPHRGVELTRLKFLCNAWVYMDVMARLTSFDCDEGSQFDNALWPMEGVPDVEYGNEEPGFGINFGMPIDARLDPLMGCASTLFPVIGHVANLVRKVCRSQKNSPHIISTARDWMETIERWEPPAYIERPEDPATDVQHALQTAEAYRYAILLHLHQSVPELPSHFADDQYAQRVLQYLATVPLTSRTLIVHVFPLMVAGCQVTEPEDREWVRGRWGVMRDLMRIGVVDKCLEVTEEVWRRRDDYEARSPGQRRMVATADLNSSQRRRLHRAPTVGPGRTGVVFSYDPVDSNTNEHEMSRSGSSRPPRMIGNQMIMGKIDVAYTVRGHLHWVGVMWEWGYEILLG